MEFKFDKNFNNRESTNLAIKLISSFLMRSISKRVNFSYLDFKSSTYELLPWLKKGREDMRKLILLKSKILVKSEF